MPRGIYDRKKKAGAAPAVPKKGKLKVTSPKLPEKDLSGLKNEDGGQPLGRGFYDNRAGDLHKLEGMLITLADAVSKAPNLADILTPTITSTAARMDRIAEEIQTLNQVVVQNTTVAPVTESIEQKADEVVATKGRRAGAPLPPPPPPVSMQASAPAPAPIPPAPAPAPLFNPAVPASADGSPRS